MCVLAVFVSASWIAGGFVAPPEENYNSFFKDSPAPVLRRSFDLEADATNATWRIAAAGMVDAFVNGERVTPTALPGWTDYDCRVLIYDYDVARFLRRGENVLELRLGNGWYNLLPMKMWGRYNLRETCRRERHVSTRFLTSRRAKALRRSRRTAAGWRQTGRLSATASILASGLTPGGCLWSGNLRA